MGPLELADFTGLDTKQAVLGVMLEKTGDPVFKPISLLDKLVKEGKFGRKTGEGFYRYWLVYVKLLSDLLLMILRDDQIVIKFL